MIKIYKNIMETIMLLTLAFVILIYRVVTKFKSQIIYIGLILTIFTYIGGFKPVNDVYTSNVYAFEIDNDMKDEEELVHEENIELSQYTPITLTPIEIPLSRLAYINREYNGKIDAEIEEEIEENEKVVEVEEEIILIPEVIVENDIIETETGSLVKCNLPKDYGDYINITSFKPYMDYRLITNTRSAAYRVSHSESAYTDDNGFRRFRLTDDDFKHEGDDYLIALGSAFTKGGIEGQRFLIVGENGMYTGKIGDHKSDLHTDSKNMYSFHGVNKQYGGLIEFVVNSTTLESSIKRSGSANTSSVLELTGDIVAIYRIDDNIK